MALSTRWKEAPGDWLLMVQAKYSCNMEKLLVLMNKKHISQLVTVTAEF